MSNFDVSLNELVQVTRQTLLAGGAIVRRGFDRKRQVTFKTPVSPVTQVDVASEKKIISIIHKKFPTHTFLAEEMAFKKGLSSRAKSPAGYRWVIDPLDGTVNFIHHIPQCCVSVAVEKNGVLLAGGVYDPFQDELFMAAKGKGATVNGRKIQVSPEKKMVKSLVITGFPYDRNRYAFQYLKLLKPFLEKCADLRRFGSAAIDLAWVASGRAEAFVECKLSPWDVAAGILLVQEAGGRVTDFKGQPYDLTHPEETFASNGLIHSSIIKILH